MEAIILAGGLGTRLRSVVPELPKCMASVAGRPFLHYLLKQLGNSGFTHVILSLGYKQELIEDWISKNQWPFSLSFSVEKEPLGTGGALRRALAHAREKQVLIMNGDTFFDVNLEAFYGFHIQNKAEISIALKPMMNFDRYGNVETDEKCKITAFKEKKPCSVGQINGGIYLINCDTDLINVGKEKFSFETEVLQKQAGIADLFGFIGSGYFIDIGIPEDFHKATIDFKEWKDGGLTKKFDTLFLDRDGVINRRRLNDYVKKWEEFQFLPGVLEALTILSGYFKQIVIVTNQRGVGKGMMSEDDLICIHDKMISEIGICGGRIDKIYYCIDTNEDSLNRKPNPGMAFQARKDFPDIDFKKSIMIGDEVSDMDFGNRLGMKSILINYSESKDGLLAFALDLSRQSRIDYLIL